MVNLVNLANTTFSNYVDFLEKTTTVQRIGAHAITLGVVIVFRLCINANPANIAFIHEAVIVVGLVSHIFIAILTGRNAAKKLDGEGVDPNISQRFNKIDQQLRTIREEISGLRNNP